MKVKMKMKVKREVDIVALKIDIPVRYGEEDIPNDFPLRVKAEDLDMEMCERWRHYNDHDRWQAVVNIESGIIENWPKGRTGDFCMKVCDEGFYYLLDGNGTVVASIEQDYVPNGAIPPEDGYGDYVELVIDENGKIRDWYKRPDFSEFFNDQE